ncbi:restriction endonuclease subunit S [Streptomyces sp. NPDC001966]
MTATQSIRLKYLYTSSGECNHPGEEILSVYREYGVIPKSSRSDNFNKTPDNVERYLLVRPGDLVVNRMKAWQGSLGVSAYRGIVSGDYEVLRPVSTAVSERYMHYALRSRHMVADYKVRSTGIRPSQWRLYWDQMGEIRVSLPPLQEQLRIADFLDAETGKMDAMLRARSKMYELLDERIENQILAVIGRSRLGDRTAGDPVLAMRWLLDKRVRPTLESSEVITAFRDGQVTARSLRRVEGYTNSASSDPQGQAVRIGDVVVHGLDGFAGAIGTSEAEGNCSPVYHVLTPKKKGDALYYGRMLRTLALQDYLTGFSFSTRERAFDFRNWDMFGRIPIPVASLSEQRHIGEQIRTVRPLRDKFGKFGNLLAERRQSLITAAVTGQFDVSTASGRNVTE